MSKTVLPEELLKTRHAVTVGFIEALVPDGAKGMVAPPAAVEDLQRGLVGLARSPELVSVAFQLVALADYLTTSLDSEKTAQLLLAVLADRAEDLRRHGPEGTAAAFALDQRREKTAQVIGVEVVATVEARTPPKAGQVRSGPGARFAFSKPEK